MAFADHLAQNYTPNTVIVDATASDEPPAQYLDWMRKGIHVITPNKKLNSGRLAVWTPRQQGVGCPGGVRAVQLPKAAPAPASRPQQLLQHCCPSLRRLWRRAAWLGSWR